MLLYTVSSTFLYFQQAEIINANFIDTDRRTAVFASIDLAVNTLTLLTQAFLTGRIMRWLGVGATLALLPAVSVAGFLTLGFAPVIAAFVVFQVMRRASNFALARPTREVLYTVVAREDRFKAKSFLDTFVYRGGDQVGAWSYAGLSAAGLGVAGVSFVAVPLCGIWLLVALWLGRRQERMRAAQQPPVLAVAREDAENARPG
jgi:AAA family ATP:ADP antiporter